MDAGRATGKVLVHCFEGKNRWVDRVVGDNLEEPWFEDRLNSPFDPCFGWFWDQGFCSGHLTQQCVHTWKVTKYFCGQSWFQITANQLSGNQILIPD